LGFSVIVNSINNTVESDILAEKFVWMNLLKERKVKSGNGLNSGNAAVVGKN